MISQSQAITGRKPRRRYVDIINAKTPYLPGLYAAKEDRAYRDEMAQLEKEGLDLSRQRMEDEAKWAEKNLKLQEEQGKKANTLGMINLGLTGGLGYMKNKSLQNILTSDSGGLVSSGGTGVMSSGPMGLAKAEATGIPESIASTPGSWTSGIGSNIGGALTRPGTYGYGALGAFAGKGLGGGDKTRSALWGAGIGAAANLLSGGSITSSIISGILGGAGGGLFG